MLVSGSVGQPSTSGRCPRTASTRRSCASRSVPALTAGNPTAWSATATTRSEREILRSASGKSSKFEREKYHVLFWWCWSWYFFVWLVLIPWETYREEGEALKWCWWWITQFVYRQDGLQGWSAPAPTDGPKGVTLKTGHFRFRKSTSGSRQLPVSLPLHVPSRTAPLHCLVNYATKPAELKTIRHRAEDVRRVPRSHEDFRRVPSTTDRTAPKTEQTEAVLWMVTRGLLTNV